MFPTAVFLGTVVASTETFFLSQLLLSAHYAYRRYYWFALTLIACTVLMALSITVLKHFLAVPRPEAALINANGYAFPSAHAAGIAFFAISTWFYVRTIWNKKSSALLIVTLLGVSVLIGYSRIYFGVHTPIQVMAGYAVGVFYALLFLLIATR